MNQEQPADNALPTEIEAGIERIRNNPAPPESLDRAMAAATKIGADDPPRRNGMRHSAERRFAGKLVVALTVVVLVSIGFLTPRSPVVWGDVVQSMEGVTWLKLTPRNSEIGFTSWVSPSRRIIGVQHRDGADFVDQTAREHVEYDKKTGTLCRLPVTRPHWPTLETVQEIITAGAVESGSIFSGFKVVDQESRTVKEGDRTLNEFALRLKQSATVLAMTVRVDPQTRLPVSLAITGNEETIHYDVSYPDDGPDDIYALGAPRDLKITDRLPSHDMKVVLKKLNDAFGNFGDYSAIVCNERGIPWRFIRRDGDCWRFDRCVATDRTQSLPDDPDRLIEVTSDNDWWKQRLTEFDLQPVFVCDGEAIYRFTKNGEKVLHRRHAGRSSISGMVETTHYLVEWYAWPPHSVSSDFTHTLTPAAKDGPDGTMVLDVQAVVPPSRNLRFRRGRYWLDPKLGYAAVQEEMQGFTDLKLPDDPFKHLDQTNQLREFSEFRNSPKGHSYPTVVTWKNVMNKDGSGEPRDITTYYHLDFESEIPDDVFQISGKQAEKRKLPNLDDFSGAPFR